MGWQRNRGTFTPDLNGLRGTFYETFGVLYGGMEPFDAGGGTTVPTTVLLGCSHYYSMPTDHAGTAECVYLEASIPGNWNPSTDMRLMVWFTAADAETVGEKYAWRMEYYLYDYGGTMSATFTEVSATTTVAAAATTQYYQHVAEAVFPYSTPVGTMERGGFFVAKLHRRILGTTGEALLAGVQFGYWGTSAQGGTTSGTLQAKLLPALRKQH